MPTQPYTLPRWALDPLIPRMTFYSLRSVPLSLTHNICWSCLNHGSWRETKVENEISRSAQDSRRSPETQRGGERAQIRAIGGSTHDSQSSPEATSRFKQARGCAECPHDNYHFSKAGHPPFSFPKTVSGAKKKRTELLQPNQTIAKVTAKQKILEKGPPAPPFRGDDGQLCPLLFKGMVRGSHEMGWLGWLDLQDAKA